jgi:hypothetical protein
MKDGHAIHGSYEVKTLGKPVSHGCVRISPHNAAMLYDLVAKTGLAFRPGIGYYAEPLPQPQRRGGFFRRLFGGGQ